MKHFRDQGSEPGLEDVSRLLRASRPSLEEHEAELMVNRITRRTTTAAVGRTTQENTLRSRLAIIAMLVLGFAFSGSGVGLALSGSSSSGATSSGQQYDKPDKGGVLDQNESGNGQGNNGVNGSNDSGDATQPSRQTTVESGDTGSSLPFTGFAAVPVMLIGVALLAGGFALRRRSALDR